MRCTRVEPWVYGQVMVKFDTEKHPLPCPLICYMPCARDATRSTRSSDGLVFHRCDVHAADPISGTAMSDEVSS